MLEQVAVQPLEASRARSRDDQGGEPPFSSSHPSACLTRARVQKDARQPSPTPVLLGEIRDRGSCRGCGTNFIVSLYAHERTHRKRDTQGKNRGFSPQVAPLLSTQTKAELSFHLDEERKVHCLSPKNKKIRIFPRNKKVKPKIRAYILYVEKVATTGKEP